MPAGVPVGTLAIGKAGATNAGLLAAAILATADPGLAKRLEAMRRHQTAGVAEAARMIVPPGSTIGIIGGGQLGRMLALAAAQLGYRCHVYAPDEQGPAAAVAARITRGAFDDEAALASFGREVDVVTYEFENVPTAPLAALATRVPLHPPVEALEIAQDRLTEKDYVRRHGGRPAPFAAVDDRAGLDSALAASATPAILKTRRFGYDGKGQARIDSAGDAERAWQTVRGEPSVLEGLVRFDAEFSILLCRGADGETMIWDAPVNRHEGGILVRSEIPAGPSLAPPSPRARRSPAGSPTRSAMSAC